MDENGKNDIFTTRKSRDRDLTVHTDRGRSIAHTTCRNLGAWQAACWEFATYPTAL